MEESANCQLAQPGYALERFVCYTKPNEKIPIFIISFSQQTYAGIMTRYPICVEYSLFNSTFGINIRTKQALKDNKISTFNRCCCPPPCFRGGLNSRITATKQGIYWNTTLLCVHDICRSPDFRETT